METIWTTELRIYPALPLVVFGTLLFARGFYVMCRGWWMPLQRPGKNLTVIRGMRTMLFGGSLAAAAAGWFWQLPALTAAGLCIGFEETIETSIAAWAPRQEYEAAA